MICWCYAVAYNEERLLPTFLRYYGAFCQKITIYDHYSTDRTREIAQAHGATVKDYPGKRDEFDEWEFVGLANQAWKEARGESDWVIWVDIDEILYHPEITKHLEKLISIGVTVPDVQGYTMIQDIPPEQGLWWNGVKDSKYSKRCIFNPNLIADIHYGLGRHIAAPIGQIKTGGRLSLLHYTYFGPEYFIERRQRLHKRRCHSDEYEHQENGKYSLEWFETVERYDIRGDYERIKNDKQDR